ncbi:MAG: cbb3-type cytochrome oxidase assembly protein CcoS [Mesorhizobium sp.]|uniref:cbb3-type cytochrome oxidase assembly protein CcoS n=1 Tax=Mesorhizobium sp. TaxID=1871066 RepID=UPI000FE438BA|nr:cbb3-type cytochrome oxidase assembly protein CcoS [Mesorhizobium sp.]RWN53345.1 MAG: cbb3-type cytochrome oxidase assembly protein CcoS [Mesorhizobium sp.]RWO39265.1 MAG: cbb3-type cytochrome oxidase assembly protein CcoS [Mesorhizobium sp.]
MNYLVWLVPIALGMGVAGLAAFLWSMRSGQYEDLDGAAERVLVSDAADVPLRQYGWKSEAAAHEARPKRGKRRPPTAFSQGAERTEGFDNVSSW